MLMIGGVVFWWFAGRTEAPASPAPSIDDRFTVHRQGDATGTGVDSAPTAMAPPRQGPSRPTPPTVTRSQLAQLELCALQAQDREVLRRPAPVDVADASTDAQAVLAFRQRQRQEAQARERIRPSSCDRLRAEQLEGRLDALRALAAAGDAEASLCYAVLGASAEYLPAPNSDAWVQAMQRYREQGPRAAARAAAAGMPGALVVQFEMVSPPQARLGLMTVPYARPDAALALRYALTLASLQERRLLPTGVRLYGDWSAQARQLARGLPLDAARRAESAARQDAERFAAQPAEGSTLCPGANGIWL